MQHSPPALSQPEPGLSKRAALLAALLGAVGAQVFGAAASLVVLLALAVLNGASKLEELQALAERPIVLLLAGPAVSLSLLGVACCAPLLLRVSLKRALGLSPPPVWSFPLAVCAIPGVAVVGDLLAQGLSTLLPHFTLGTGLALMEASRSQSLPLLILVLALLPGVAEELFFRGMLQRAFGNTFGAALVVAAVFAVYHLDPPHVAATLPIGLYMGWLGVRFKSTVLPAAVHVANNSLAIAAARSDTLAFGFGSEVGVPWWWAGPSLSVAVVVLALVARATKEG